MKNIRVSPQHGVNPAIPLCFFCNQEKNEVILAGHMKGDVEAPRNAVWDKQPCDKCREWMKQGIILISVRNGESGDNPYRTGNWIVVKDDLIEHMGIQPQTLKEHILKARVAFIPDETWNLLGLPTSNT
jgi:hypothetical protein